MVHKLQWFMVRQTKQLLKFNVISTLQIAKVPSSGKKILTLGARQPLVLRTWIWFLGQMRPLAVT